MNNVSSMVDTLAVSRLTSVAESQIKAVAKYFVDEHWEIAEITRQQLTGIVAAGQILGIFDNKFHAHELECLDEISMWKNRGAKWAWNCVEDIANNWE